MRRKNPNKVENSSLHTVEKPKPVVETIQDVSQATSFKYELKELAYNWIMASTSHGLPSVFRVSHTYLKIMWGIFFVASTSTCAYLLISYMITYFKYETNVNIQMITEVPANFPAITICNLNPYYKRRSENYIKTALKENNLTWVTDAKVLTDTAFSLLSSTLSVIKSYTATDQNLSSDARKSLGWEIEEMLVSCYFNDEKCGTNDFVWLLTYEYGNCYTFNSKSSSVLQTIHSGPGTGLHLELFVGDGDFDSQFVYPTGAYVIINNQSIVPLISNEGFSVPTGFESQISIKKTYLTKLSYPYSDCITDNTSPDSYGSSLYKAMFNTLNHKTYRQKYCFKLCYQQSVIDSCDCSDARLPNPFPSRNGRNISVCRTSTQLTCVSVSKKTFESGKIYQKCSIDCPVECSSITYSNVVNMATYPTGFYAGWLTKQTNFGAKFQNNQTSSAKIKESVIKIDIFYECLEFMHILETASITWDSLMGNIGGQLGLFIGISVLSFAELFELIAEIIRLYYHHRKSRKLFEKSANAIVTKI